MRGTRLWTEAGSPLIRGRSRRERSFLRDWLLASTLAVVLSAALVQFALRSGQGLATGNAILSVVVGGVVLSAPFVWLLRRMGWLRAWLTGGVTAGVLLVGAYFAYVHWYASGSVK